MATASQVGSQGVSEGIPGPRGTGEEICSVGVPNVREGEFLDIEVDSGAEVSCLPASIGANTHPLHETRLSMCGGHHVAVGGGKLREFGGRILGLEARDVEVMLRTCSWTLAQDLSRCGLETVVWRCLPFQGSFRHSHHAREEKVCLVFKSETHGSQRVAMRGKQRILLDRGAGVLPVQEEEAQAGGPAVPEDVEESALVKELVPPLSSPPLPPPLPQAAADRERAHRQRACSVQDLVSRRHGRVHPHRAGGRETAIPAIAGREFAGGHPVRASTAAFCKPRWEDGLFLGMFDRSDELYVHRKRHAQGPNTQASRGYRTS